jgi:hypothetical protein
VVSATDSHGRQSRLSRPERRMHIKSIVTVQRDGHIEWKGNKERTQNFGKV